MVIGDVLYQTISYFFTIVGFLIFVRILLSWFPNLQGNQLAEIVYGITEPILAPFKRLIPPMGMMDLSPMVAIISLIVLQQILLSIVQIAFGLPPQ